MTKHHSPAGPVTVIGGGLAGCEAAWALARAGARVRLVEMRPETTTPAHRTPLLAELVCSNSLKSDSMTNASGLLKAEMEALGSLVMEAARNNAVPAGGALAVDREGFSRCVTEAIASLEPVTLVREQVEAVPRQGVVVVATGPLTSENLARDIIGLTGEESLSFYDAIAPIVTAESVDFTTAFRASRYGRGGDDYINCPLDEEDYNRFVEALLSARRVPLRDFEEPRYFEGCLPVEVMAERGPQTLAHGPMKPVGLTDPRTGKRPHAVVQLRQDDAAASLYNMVGFQTRLAHPEQERVFRMIPGLEKAEFARLGSIHRNTFIHSPALLDPDLSLRKNPDVFFAGQITGVEGYMESAATGIVAGINAAARARGEKARPVPPETMIGALIAYVTSPEHKEFQPINANFGIMPPTPDMIKKSARKQAVAQRAMEAIKEYAAACGIKAG